ncbi:MAG: glycosyltransferase family 4 protein [Deltaproteobacteria bacterium]|jgi:glycosyltransferase involved in cell wall biosynthesis|nr:glycosyltransferase family 4 protein [Deltaproteobacteria bacterium]
MRIGVVTTSFPRYPGDGAGSFVAEHVDWLRAQGHQVEVVCADHDQAVDQPQVWRVAAGPGLFYEGGAPEALARGHWPAAVGFTARLAAELRRHDWDAMIAHWLVPAAVAALARPRLPLAAIAHSGDVDLLCRTRAMPWVARLLRARRARLTLVGEHLRQRVASSCSGSLASWVRAAEVVPMGIDIQRFRAEPVARRSGRMVFLGRLVDIKGVRVLGQVMAELAELGELVVAGDGPLRQQVEAWVARAGARYIGPVRGRQRDELLQSAELVLIPSVELGERREGAPVTAFEAMAAGAAVVASRSGGLSELPAETVTWIEPGSAESLLAAARRLLSDQRERDRQLGCAAAYAAGRDWRVVGPRLMPPL